MPNDANTPFILAVRRRTSHWRYADSLGIDKSASVRKSSTDEMGVRQELADWCFRPYHGIGPPRGAAAPFYGKVNYGKIKTLYAVLQPAGSRKREGVVQ